MTPESSDDRSELDKLRERGDTFLGMARILGRQVRALRAKVGQP